MTFKFPRTPHMKGSKGTDDDVFKNHYRYDGLVIATEKMDGSNISLSKETWFTRADNNYNKEWTYPINAWYYPIKEKLKDNEVVLGEFLHWRKSVPYNNLPSDYMLFGIKEDDLILDWETTKKRAKELGIPVVRELSKIGTFDEVVKEATSNLTKDIEGFVVRPIDSFPMDKYDFYVRKFVQGHFESTRFSDGKNNFKEGWYNEN